MFYLSEVSLVGKFHEAVNFTREYLTVEIKSVEPYGYRMLD